MKLRLLAVVAGFCALLLQSWAGDLINVDFTHVGNPAFRAKQGPAASGLRESDVWNTGGALRWSDGAASPASLSVLTGPSAWYAWHFDAMFQSYLYAGDFIAWDIVN